MRVSERELQRVAKQLGRQVQQLRKGAGVTQEELVRRLSGRLICRRCQTPYHRTNLPPKVEGRCDRCGGELYQRADDQPEVVQRRLQIQQRIGSGQHTGD